jgi:O-antigen/teichoic acid export membrane protein
MFVVLAVLARELTLDEIGVFGLLNSLAGYLLIVQNAAAGAGVRALAAATGEEQRRSAFASVIVLYLLAASAAGVLLALLGLALAETLSPAAALAADLREGAALLGLVTFAGWPLLAQRDVLRACGRLGAAAGAEVVAVLAYAALVIGIAAAHAPLALIIGAGGTIPLFAGLACTVIAARLGVRERFVPALFDRDRARALATTAFSISLADAATTAVYVVNRAVLGSFGSAAAVGLFEGPVRANNLLRSLTSALTTSSLPAGSELAARDDRRALHGLVLRGTRYSLALLVPVIVTGMVLAKPALRAWLGPDFTEGSSAMAILLAPWLLTATTGVGAAVLIATGRSRDLARWAGAVAAASIALGLVLVPPFDLDGAALASAIPSLALFPLLARPALAAAGASAGEVARHALLPSWTAGAAVAAAAGAVRLAWDPVSAPVVLATGAGGCALGWLLIYLVFFDGAERALVGGLVRRAA